MSRDSATAPGLSSTSTGTSSTSVMRWPEAMARCITRVLHGERADRVEEALDVEQEGHHHADVEAARPSTIEPPTTMTVAIAMPVSVSTIGTITCAYLRRGQVGLEIGQRLLVVERRS